MVYRFVDENNLGVRDYVCASLSVALALFYHIYLTWYSYYYPHSSLEGHMDYQRIWWVRQVYDDAREKIATIQNFRSMMMIMGFYTKITLVGAAASVELAVETPGFLAKARGFFPAILFIASFANLCFCAFSLFFLHWHTMMEEGGAAAPQGGSAAAGATAADATATQAAKPNEGGSIDENDKPVKTVGFTGRDMLKSKLHIAAMVVQLKVHFRMTQRFMLLAVAALMWNVEPVAMLAAYILLMVNFYYCDFPFPEEVSRIFHIPKDGAERGARGHTRFDHTHDRARGVIRPRTQTLKQQFSMYQRIPSMYGGGTPERSGSMQRGSWRPGNSPMGMVAPGSPAFMSPGRGSQGQMLGPNGQQPPQTQQQLLGQLALPPSQQPPGHNSNSNVHGASTSSRGAESSGSGNNNVTRPSTFHVPDVQEVTVTNDGNDDSIRSVSGTAAEAGGPRGSPQQGGGNNVTTIVGGGGSGDGGSGPNTRQNTSQPLLGAGGGGSGAQDIPPLVISEEEASVPGGGGSQNPLPRQRNSRDESGMGTELTERRTSGGGGAGGGGNNFLGSHNNNRGGGASPMGTATFSSPTPDVPEIPSVPNPSINTSGEPGNTISQNNNNRPTTDLPGTVTSSTDLSTPGGLGTARPSGASGSEQGSPLRKEGNINNNNHGGGDEGAICITSDTEDDDEEDFLAMQ